MLAQRRRRRASINPALDQRLVFAGLLKLSTSRRNVYTLYRGGVCQFFAPVFCVFAIHNRQGDAPKTYTSPDLKAR